MMRPPKPIKKLQLLGTGNCPPLIRWLVLGLCGALLIRCGPPPLEAAKVSDAGRARWRAPPQVHPQPVALAAAVQRRLALDRRTAALALTITATAGWIELEGVVPSREEQKIVESLGSDVVGVERVINRTTVGEGSRRVAPPEPPWDDAAIARAVEEVQRLSQRLTRYPIRAKVRWGVVRLQGIVPTEGVRIHAEEVIRQIPGVAAVRSGLMVQPPERG